jgi:hypothetical protein
VVLLERCTLPRIVVVDAVVEQMLSFPSHVTCCARALMHQLRCVVFVMLCYFCDQTASC